MCNDPAGRIQGMKLVPEFTGWWPDIGKKLPMEISVRKGLDRYGCKTSENTLREFSLQTVDKALLLQGFAIVGTAFLI